jgi:hypothetical protein
MATAVQVQVRRGSSSQVGTFTGAQGEVVVDTTNNRVVVQDGATAGGFAAAKLAEVLTNARTQVSDGNYTALATDRTIAYITLTASRIVSLPAASTYPTGTRLLVVDESGACSGSKTIALSANGSDLIDGTATATVNSAYGYLAIESNGANKWTIVDQVGAAGGVSSLNTATGAVTIVANDGDVVSQSGSTVTLGGPGGMVNKFRNGAIDVWQRGNGPITISTSGAYTADGWIVLPSGASVAAAQAAGRLITKNSLQVTGAASVTDVVIKQRIESYIAAAFCSQTVTVQAQVYNNTGGAITPTLTVKHAGSQDVWTSPVTDVSAAALQACTSSAWTLVSYTFSASAASYSGLEIGFDFGNNFSSSGKVQITECDIRVTPGAAVGLNANPPPPELRPIQQELAFCQRYFWADVSTAAGSVFAIGNWSSSTVGNALLSFPVTMRTSPTANYSSAGTFTMAEAITGAGNTATGISTASMGATVNGLPISLTLSGGTAGDPIFLKDAGSNDSYIYISAEI